MGLTIHYSGGKADSQKKIDELLSRLSDIAKIAKWDYWLENEKKDNVQGRNKNDSENGKSVNYKSFCANIDEGCETFEIGFNYDTLECANYYRYKSMDYTQKSGFSCKTQYSKDFVTTHHTICQLLEMIKTEYIKDLSVSDEGGYFGNWDKEALGTEIKEWDKMIKGVGKMLGAVIEKANEGKPENEKITMETASKITKD